MCASGGTTAISSCDCKKLDRIGVQPKSMSWVWLGCERAMVGYGLGFMGIESKDGLDSDSSSS